MGNPKPKQAAKVWEPELNTQAFRDRASERLEENKYKNSTAGRRPGEHGWLIQSHAEIAAELTRIFRKKIGQTHVRNLLGAAREGDVKFIAKSRYIGPIRDMLKIEQIDIPVPVERADVLRRIAELPEKSFAAHRDAVAGELKKAASSTEKG